MVRRMQPHNTRGAPGAGLGDAEDFPPHQPIINHGAPLGMAALPEGRFLISYTIQLSITAIFFFRYYLSSAVCVYVYVCVSL